MKFHRQVDFVNLAIRRGAKGGLLSLILLVLFRPAYLSAQEAVPAAAGQGYEAISADNMEAILSFLASDELEGRGTAQRGLQIAAKFLASQYTLAGYGPAPGQRSMLQTFFVLESKLDPATSISVNLNENGSKISRRYVLHTDFYIRGQGTQSFNIEAPVAFAGYGITASESGYDDYKGLKAQGKILLFLSGRPKFVKPGAAARSGRRGGSARVAAAEKAGAVAIVTIATRSIPEQMARYRRFLGRPSYSLQNAERSLPRFTVSAEVANEILAAGGLSVEALKEKIDASEKPGSFVVKNATMTLDVRINTEPKKTQNVVAYLEGSDPELKSEVVAFGAHYDHVGISEDGTIYNGADDDGSGTTGILEIARAFAGNPERPKRSLLFISHTGEERGLLGSRYYTENPVIPLESTVTMLNVDMIGRNEDNEVYVIGSDFISTELHDIGEEANQVVGLTLDYKYNTLDDPERFYYRSDHYHYAKNDIPIIFYFTGTHEDYHKETDDVRKIKFDKMQAIARLIYLTGWKVANLDHRPSHDGKLATASE